MTMAFEMDLATAEEFYKRCDAQHANTEQERIAILVELAKEGRIRSAFETKRTPDQIAEDAAKHFGKVLYIRKKKGEENENESSC